MTLQVVASERERIREALQEQADEYRREAPRRGSEDHERLMAAASVMEFAIEVIEVIDKEIADLHPSPAR